jgi:hypothetical protein
MELDNGWVKQKEWHGNPSLGYDCYMKMFNNSFGCRKIPVYVWGLYPDIYFTVSAGANSELSYTGCFYPLKPDFQEFMEMVDQKHKNKKLIR